VKVRILKKTKNELKIEIDGEGHTFCNAIQNALLKDKRVELAGYNIQHPLSASPTIFLRTKPASNSKTVLQKAVKTVQEDSDAFETAFDKALKDWRK
jgi:DNA-directed RNA polymerase subunit L